MAAQKGNRLPSNTRTASDTAPDPGEKNAAVGAVRATPPVVQETSIVTRLKTIDFSQRTVPADATNVAPQGLVAGEAIGHYRVLEQLGSGGMGHIYRALDERLEREVAIKLALDSLAADPEAMLREARALAALNHPNVVTVYEAGVHEGCAYIVMELLRGESLRARLDRTRPSFSDALSWALEILRGLSAAHNAHIMHLDVKPENVFLTKDGVVKLIDFGVARRNRTGVYEGENIVGTAAYMAPEQLLGDPLDFRADLFSFGVILHELVVGKHPFLRPQLSATMYALLNGEFFHDSRVADPDVEAIVRTCMQLEPAQRPPSAAHVLEDLERVLRMRSQLTSRNSQVAYVETEHGNVAYQGHGLLQACHWLLVPGLLSRFDAWANEVEGAAFLRTLTDAGRVILFDRAGLGASDRLSEASLPSIDEEVEHIDAILAASDASRVVLMAFDVGAPLAALCAALRPERVLGLLVVGGAPSYKDADVRSRLAACAESWGTEQNVSLCAPTLARDARTTKWIATWERITSSPKMARARLALLGHTDTSDVLPFIDCPTLVLHRENDSFCLPAQSLPFADKVVLAERVLLAGADHFPFAGEQDIAAHMVRFAEACATTERPGNDDRVLVTWLLTDAPWELLPANLRPSMALERGAMRLVRMDRPGATQRWINAHLPRDSRAVLACKARSAKAEDVFAEMEPMFVALEAGHSVATSLARSLVDGTACLLVDRAPTSSGAVALHHGTDVLPAESKRVGAAEVAQPARLRYIVPVVAMVAAAFGVGAFVFGKRNDATVQPIVSDVAPVASKVLDVAVKSTHTLTIESEPLGALVKEGSREMGKTPLAIMLDGADKQPRSFTLSLVGFEDYAFRQEPAEVDVRIVARLSKIEVRPAVSMVPSAQVSVPVAAVKRISAPKPKTPEPAPTVTQAPPSTGALEIKRER